MMICIAVSRTKLAYTEITSFLLTSIRLCRVARSRRPDLMTYSQADSTPQCPAYPEYHNAQVCRQSESVRGADRGSDEWTYRYRRINGSAPNTSVSLFMNSTKSTFPSGFRPSRYATLMLILRARESAVTCTWSGWLFDGRRTCK